MSVLTLEIGGSPLDVMLDSGSSVSLIRKASLNQIHSVDLQEVRNVNLVMASGEQLPVIGHVSTAVKIENKEVLHNLIVVDKLVAPVILGTDFLAKHKLILNFASSPVQLLCPPLGDTVASSSMPSFLLEHQKKVEKYCAVAAIEKQAIDVDSYAIPKFNNSVFDMPECSPEFQPVLEEFQQLFQTVPGRADGIFHHIPTTGSPVRVPPRRIPAHYRPEVFRQLNEMLDRGIIEHSSSPWMAPMVFVPKKSGELRLCVDYRELNKRTVRDAYPIPLPDEAQDRLHGATIFSKLDLQCGYWQLPVSSEDREKTAFCPGPGMGLFQFRVMPFGLCGAPSSFQRMMDEVLAGLPFVSTYIDDVLVYSENSLEHSTHLRQVFQRLSSAGLTLRGHKCSIGKTEVTYLGHTFNSSGMSPSSDKVDAIVNWGTPQNTSDVRRFLGISSYYRRYIPEYAKMAGPLYEISQCKADFRWSNQAQQAFSQLKEALTSAPILHYPNFGSDAGPFVLQSDASATGLGAVLEQDGHVIAYASRVLSNSEKQYSVIQRECLALVFATKQFRHYLLGRSFQLVTDHKPLQWLYSFEIRHRPGVDHGNADALSRQYESIIIEDPSVAVTVATPSIDYARLCSAQQSDPILQLVHRALLAARKPQSGAWCTSPLRRFKQLWHQLSLIEGVIFRKYAPGPTDDCVVVPILPAGLQKEALEQCHDIPSAGHQGSDKTLDRLRHQAYWVNMARDVERYCQECVRCQQLKSTRPSRAPLQSIPVGKPWEMVAADILEVPISSRGNRYLLVVQDYFSKWVEAVPLPDQTAERIVKALVDIFSRFGLPAIFHSDQGRNFESHLLRDTLAAFGVYKSRTSAYHPEGDGLVERFNRSLLQLLRVYVEKEAEWEKYLPLVLYAYRTTKQTSTGVSPFEILFGRNAISSSPQPSRSHDVSSYTYNLRSKLAQLRDLVEGNIVESSKSQKTYYDLRSVERIFQPNDLVWLSVPTTTKFSPSWEGGWKVKSILSPVSVEITDGRRKRVVHLNRLRKHIQPIDTECSRNTEAGVWRPPTVDHEVIIDNPTNQPVRRYPLRERHPPQRFQFPTSSIQEGANVTS